MKEMVVALDSGRDVGITPDGPRGPVHKIKNGTIELASRTGVLICPAGGAAHPVHSASSWDSFNIPLPFAKVVIVFGEPIEIPKSPGPADRKKYKEFVEARMMELEDRADKISRGELDYPYPPPEPYPQLENDELESD